MAKDLKISYLLECYGKLLTEKQFRVVDMYYNEDLSLAEIAEIEEITRQGVRDFLIKAEAQLNELEGELHLLEKVRLLNEFLNRQEYDKVSEHLNRFFSDWEAK